MNDILEMDIALLKSLCVSKQKLLEEREKARLDALGK